MSDSRVVAAIGLLADIADLELFEAGRGPAPRQQRAVLEEPLSMLLTPLKRNHLH